MRIGELARLTGKSVATLRYYEQLNLLASNRTKSGYRDYASEAVERVRFIARAQERGFSLEEIAGTLALCDRGRSPCGMVAKVAREKIAELERQIAALQSRHAVLTEAIRHWETGQLADSPFCPMLDTTPIERNGVNMARKVEVFTAGCPLCEPVVEMVQRLACPSYDVAVYNVKNDANAVERARAAGVARLPMVLVDGKPAECCQVGPVTEAGLRTAGIGA